jgi:hypothetical protein
MWRSVRRAKEQIKRHPHHGAKIISAAKSNKVAWFWDENVGRHCGPFAHWESPAPIQHGLNKLVTGDISIHPPVWFMQHLLGAVAPHRAAAIKRLVILVDKI